MYCVVVVKHDEVLERLDQLPARGQVIGTAAQLFGNEGLNSLGKEQALELARGYNTQELEAPRGTWAVVRESGEDIKPGTPVILKNAVVLN